ncbi:MAG: hypothetical protein J6333_06810 [Planctomycetes bacterium]|nr:hypothetical protein [Planctomycetota bacterium]
MNVRTIKTFLTLALVFPAALWAIEVGFDDTTLGGALMCLYHPKTAIYVEDKLLANPKTITLHSSSLTRQEVLARLMAHFGAVIMANGDKVVVIGADASQEKKLVRCRASPPPKSRQEPPEGRTAAAPEKDADKDGPSNLRITNGEVVLQGRLELRRIDDTYAETKYSGWYWTICFTPQSRFACMILRLKLKFDDKILTAASGRDEGLRFQEFIVKPFATTDPSPQEFAQRLSIVSFMLK